MRKVNLLEQAPKIKRNITPGWRKQENREIARRFDKEFFDGKRVNGYGGYTYDGRWRDVVRNLEKIYGINNKSSVLDIGCAKGFLIYDLIDMIPGINVSGLDISEYALNHSIERVRPYLVWGSADELPWADNSFDTILAINTIHNLPKERCKKALEEIERVCVPGGNKFVQVDAYRTESEKQAINNWNLTAQTILHVDDWFKLFHDANYNGDYFWTILDFKD